MQMRASTTPFTTRYTVERHIGNGVWITELNTERPVIAKEYFLGRKKKFPVDMFATLYRLVKIEHTIMEISDG